MASNRIDFIDIAKGIGMFLVIVGHVETYDFINRMIYSFHMPLFFVLSGFFLKPDHFGKKSIIKDFRSIWFHTF